jgi:hypothetical protein
MISTSSILFICALIFTSTGGFGCGADEIGRAMAGAVVGTFYSLNCAQYGENEVTDGNRAEVSDRFVRCCKYKADTPAWDDKDKTDSDGDGLVNICDPAMDDADFDEDGVEDGPDNCPLTPNPGQEFIPEEGDDPLLEEYMPGDACW